MTTALRTEVAIIGGGLIGSSAAFALARAGVPTILIDRDDCGAKASGVNFGGVRRQGRNIPQLHLAMRAHTIWTQLNTLIGANTEYVPSGHIKLARTDEDLAELEAYRAATIEFALELEIISGTAFRKKFPCFGAEVIGASFCPNDGQANPRLVGPAFAYAAREAGALLLEHWTVEHISRQSSGLLIRSSTGLEIHATMVINASGAWGSTIAAQLGDAVPMTIQYPTMLVTEPLAPIVPVSVGIQGGGFYARQAVRGNIVMGGGFGEGTEADRCRPGRSALSLLAVTAPSIIPALQNAQVIRSWSGIEGYFPDKNPVICASPSTPGVIHAFGFSGAGFQIGPAVGEILAEMVQGLDTLPCPDAFSVQRFAPNTNNKDLAT